jgi:hypothetical protein
VTSLKLPCPAQITLPGLQVVDRSELPVICAALRVVEKCVVLGCTTPSNPTGTTVRLFTCRINEFIFRAEFSSLLPATLTQSSSVQFGAARCCSVQFGAVRCCSVLLGAVRCSPVQFGAARCSSVQPGAVRCCSVQFSAARCSAAKCS